VGGSGRGGPCPEEISWMLREGVECVEPGGPCRGRAVVVGGFMVDGCPGYLGSWGRVKNKRAGG